MSHDTYSKVTTFSLIVIAFFLIFTYFRIAQLQTQISEVHEVLENIDIVEIKYVE